MLEVIKNILVSPLNSPLLLVVAIAYMLVESIRIYDARLIQGHTRDFKSGVFQRAEGRQLPFWVGYIHILGWALFIVMILLNWKFAIVFFVLLFILRVLPILENIGEFLMRGFINGNRNISNCNTITIKNSYEIIDVIGEPEFDNSARKNHHVFANIGYSEFVVSQAIKLGLANEFLLISSRINEKSKAEKLFSGSFRHHESDYLFNLEDFMSYDEMDHLFDLKFESSEFRQALNKIRCELAEFKEKDDSFFNEIFFESITSFGYYCISIGVSDPNYWENIYDRIGLNYTSNCPNGNEPFDEY